MCQFCGKPSTRLYTYDADEPDKRSKAAVNYYLIWPPKSPRDLDPAAPEAVRSLYTEASLCEEAGALRGAAAMLRAAVEELCKERGATGRWLADKIEDLTNRGLSREVVDDLHQARTLGNWTMHDGVTFAADEVADVAELIAEAVTVIYVQPAQRAAMRAARKARQQAVGGQQ